MRNNKGYSLVELLVTLAVFSIVMVTIVTLMSTTANTYGKGQRETELQEEAQIVANQIENLIIDADAAVTKDAAGVYKIVHGTKAEYLKQDGSKIMYSDNGSTWAPLADYVDSFKIDGLTNKDNEVTVAVKMKSGNEIVDSTTGLGTSVGESNYSFEKTVYYRNQVESLANFTIKEGSSPAASSGGSNEYTLNVKRYETYNLKALKDIDHFEIDPADASKTKILIHGSTTDAGRFELENKKFKCKGSNGEEQIDGAFVKCDNDTNKNFSATVLKTDNVWVNGYQKDGTCIKIYLTLDPVWFDTGSGVFVHQSAKEINGKGNRGLYVMAEGINMYNAVKQGLAVSCDVTIYADADNNKSPGSSETKKEFTGKTLGTTDDNSYSSTPGQSGFPGMDQLNIGIAADAGSGGIAIISPNGFEGSTVSSTMRSNKMRYRVKMSFSSGGSGIACSTGTFDVAIRVAGNTGE